MQLEVQKIQNRGGGASWLVVVQHNHMSHNYEFINKRTVYNCVASQSFHIKQLTISNLHIKTTFCY